MTLYRTIHICLAAAAAAATLAGTAAAGGEPKNQWPFTRPVGERSPQAAPHSTAGGPAIQGEPKNEPPFTQPTTVVITSGSGFHWADGGIGAAAGIGITLAGTGAFLVVVARRATRPA